MKLCNINTTEGVHLAIKTDLGLIDANAAGFSGNMDSVIAENSIEELERISKTENLPVLKTEDITFANVVNKADKLICVGLNYSEHAKNSGVKTTAEPTLFSKFSDALCPSDDEIFLPPYEKSYDYEAELVIIIGKSAFNVSEEEAIDCIFGYTCGNDLSCREAQLRTTQWLIGKAIAQFGPCGPYVVTSDEFDPCKDNYIRCYVNGEMKQNGKTSQMIFNCAEIVSYISKYIRLNPGDLIFSGTPSGVVVEKKPDDRVWLKSGDVVEVDIEGIGVLRNKLV